MGNVCSVCIPTSVLRLNIHGSTFNTKHIKASAFKQASSVYFEVHILALNIGLVEMVLFSFCSNGRLPAQDQKL